MSSHLQAAPLVLSVKTAPTPRNPEELYLDLMKKILTRALMATGIERHTIRPAGPKSRLLHGLNQTLCRAGVELVRLTPSSSEDYLESGHAATNRVEDAETMLGTRQLDHVQRCIVEVLDRKIPGDLIEAGVWRGGMTIFMRAVLMAYGIQDRRVWVADSFAGLPEIDRRRETFAWERGDMAVSLESVKNNFARYGLLDNQTVFLKGFFSETLPQAQIDRIAILRIDADLYQSTVDALRHLYPLLSAGGYAIFDDYQNLPDCRRAIDDFRKNEAIADEIQLIDGRAVCWRKRT